ncbi:MAG: nucleoside-diphosphate kinase [Fimbriimonadaceae bacterium]|nr:nucleoside-diphosphate kinase [Fimbriimonadaceae bacterium]
MERTLAILKPDCVRRGLLGTVISRIEAESFRIVAARLRHFTAAQAEGFYAVHQGKGFFPLLIEFMTSGPCLTLILERDDAINHWRNVLVELRQTYTSDLTENLCHGSDAPETSAFECGYLFAGCELR